MDIFEISFYKDFECLAGSCPQTCCHGWVIPLTEEDEERFRTEKGLQGLSLSLLKSGKNPPVLNGLLGTCPYHSHDGLCRLQLKHGHSFIPEACRDYPRFFRNYGPFEERLIDLSCVRGAELFLDNIGNLGFSLHKGEPESGRCTTNDDLFLLYSLKSLRHSMISPLQEASSQKELEASLRKGLDYSIHVEEAFINGNDSFLADNPFEDFSPVPSIDGKETADGARLFPAPLSSLKELIRSGLDSPLLFHANPALSRLLHLFGRAEKKELKTDAGWQATAGAFLSEHAELIPKYSAYFSYYLLGYFLSSFEDYSFRINYGAGLLHLNMLLLFDILHEKHARSLSKKEQAIIIACYNKKAYFNENVRKKLREFARQTLTYPRS